MATLRICEDKYGEDLRWAADLGYANAMCRGLGALCLSLCVGDDRFAYQRAIEDADFWSLRFEELCARAGARTEV